MTDPTALALLRDAENYLSALHGSVARHDNLAANLGCAGCELRDRIAAALPTLVAVQTPVDRAALRDRIAETMARADGWEWAAANLSSLSTPAADRYRRCADAVLAVLPAPADQAAEELRLALSQALDLGTGAPWAAIRDRADELRRLADETTAVAASVSAANGSAPIVATSPVDRAAVLREAADIADQTATEMRECDGTWPEEWSSRDVRDAVQAAAAQIRDRANQIHSAAEEPTP